MAKGYSKDLRERVVAIVEEGDSAREALRELPTVESIGYFNNFWLHRRTG